MHTHPAPAYMAPTVELDSREDLASFLSWYTVALIVLLALSADILVAVGIWCIAHGQSLVVFWKLGANNMVTIACQ